MENEKLTPEQRELDKISNWINECEVNIYELLLKKD